MIIRGHDVRYRISAYSGSYARAVILRERQMRFFGFPIKRLVTVWEGSVELASDAKRMLPDELEAWFTKTVDEYEAYQKAWKAYHDRKDEPCVD